MMEWFQRLMPREDKFFDLFEAHAATLIAGAGALRQLLEGGPKLPSYCEEVVEREAQADLIAAEVMESVRRTSSPHSTEATSKS